MIQRFRSIKLRIRGIELNNHDGFKYWKEGYRVGFQVPITPNFSLTDESFKSLQDNGVPKEVLDKLKPLEDRNYRLKESFLSAIEERIGIHQEYTELILQNANTTSVEVINKERLNFLFVEPGVKQDITYVTKIPKIYKYFVAHATFNYDEYTPHFAEKVFDVSVLKPGVSC